MFTFGPDVEHLWVEFRPGGLRAAWRVLRTVIGTRETVPGLALPAGVIQARWYRRHVREVIAIDTDVSSPTFGQEIGRLDVLVKRIAPGPVFSDEPAAASGRTRRRAH